MGSADKSPDLALALQEPLQQVAHKLVSATSHLMRSAITEEDLRIGFEKILSPLFRALGIKSEPRYEKTTVLGGRSDALHGQVIIEYESPKAFQSKSRIHHAYGQLVGYIQGEAKNKKETLFLFAPKLVGVGFDGQQIFFVHYRGSKTKPKTELDKKDFVRIGPYPFHAESACTFLTYLRALDRLPLTAEHLADKFGPKSEVARDAVSAFADALKNWGKERVPVFFNEWKRLFGIVYGEEFGTRQAQETKALSRVYGVSKDTNFQELLFSVHTYFAFLMKLIAAELVTLKESAFTASFSHQLTHTLKDELQTQLTDIENGGIYAKRGIANFLEGDFFRWYLDAFSPRLEEAIREIARALSEFEPATTTIDPESARDLLKKLYQYLVPQEVRHNLGEYYTPDWLAELLLNEVGYKGNTLKRVLDPACGSGTFLVLTIQRAKEYGLSHKEPPLETAKRIAANIWGFDLNPLAVIAARTNYLFALGDIAQELSSFEIPIYLADSVLWPEKAGDKELNFAGGEHIKIQTSGGRFHVPYIWVANKGFLMRKAAPLVEEMTKQGYSPAEAMERFKKEGLVFTPHEKIVQNFYSEILELEKEGKNGIWARFLKNIFAPLNAKNFDFVVGNPPWVRWDYLSDEYRKETLQLWKDFGLFSLKGFETRLGGGKKDFSMLFTYAASDYYLKDGGKLGFLITQEVFKSKGAGEGFRRFKLGKEGKSLKVLKAHDLATVQPFEGAANKTAAIILRRGGETTYPVPYYVWKRKKGVGRIATDKKLKDALPFLQKRKLFARPIGSKVGPWQTLAADQKWLTALQGENSYNAHSGAYISPYGVFWLKIEQVLSEGELLVSNLVAKGKTKIQQVREVVEPELVYPALRGSDIQRWQANPDIFVLLVQYPEKREPYPESQMKKEWPRTYGYLTRFRETLLSRKSKPLKQLAERTAFYAVFGVGDYTVANYKVVWKRMTNDIIAAVVSQSKTPFGHKIVIPLETTALIAAKNESEAHYLCAIVNSTPVREFIKSFSSAGRGFGTPSVMKYVGIPQFDSNNKLHQKLSKLSKDLHNHKAKDGILDNIAPLEKEVDSSVRKLFGIREA